MAEERVHAFSRTQFAPGDYVIGEVITAVAPDGVELTARIVALDAETITVEFLDPGSEPG